MTPANEGAAMGNQSEDVTQAMVWLDQPVQIAKGWTLSPAAWSQFGLLAAVYLLARLVAGRVLPHLRADLTPAAGKTGMLTDLRRFALRFQPILLPLLAYGLTEGGEGVTRSLFGSGDVIACGKRVFLVLAAHQLVREVLMDGFLHLLGRYVLIPSPVGRLWASSARSRHGWTPQSSPGAASVFR